MHISEWAVNNWTYKRTFAAVDICRSCITFCLSETIWWDPNLDRKYRDTTVGIKCGKKENTITQCRAVKSSWISLGNTTQCTTDSSDIERDITGIHNTMYNGQQWHRARYHWETRHNEQCTRQPKTSTVSPWNSVISCIAITQKDYHMGAPNTRRGARWPSG